MLPSFLNVVLCNTSLHINVLVWLLISVSSIIAAYVRNPIHSVLSLILVFIGTGFMLMLLNIEYLAFVFLVVYAGAVAILILYSVMLIKTRGTDLNISTLAYLPITFFLHVTIFFHIAVLVNETFNKTQVNILVQATNNIRATANVHYPWYLDKYLYAKHIFITNMYNFGFLPSKEAFIKFIYLVRELPLALSHKNYLYNLENYKLLLTAEYELYINYFNVLYSSINIKAFAHCFYINFYATIFVAALILLIAMIGSISLVAYKQKDTKRQDNYKQVLRDFYKNLKQ